MYTLQLDNPRSRSGQIPAHPINSLLPENKFAPYKPICLTYNVQTKVKNIPVVIPSSSIKMCGKLAFEVLSHDHIQTNKQRLQLYIYI